MRQFADLYRQLDETTATNRKLAALVAYFRDAPAADAAWAVYFLSGKRLRRLINTRELREWTASFSGMSLWLVEECYEHVGDLAETMALLLPEGQARQQSGSESTLQHWVEQRLLPLKTMHDDQSRQQAVASMWRDLPSAQRLVLNKLLTGAFRVGVAKRLVTRALAEVAGVDSTLIAHRLMGKWQPDAQAFRALIDPTPQAFDRSAPYPFYLASPLPGSADELGDHRDWIAEWKWDGIRAQLIRREDGCHLWSRGEELLNGRFPELEDAAAVLPDDCVIDGEIVAWRDDRPLPFSLLQTRIGRKQPGAVTLRKAPVSLLAYDLLEIDGTDCRQRPWHWRRQQLEQLLQRSNQPRLMVSPLLACASWSDLQQRHHESRDRGVEGFVLKHRESAYEVGRKRGGWWKWKVDPYTIDAVLIYAQPGHGRRSNLMTDYTFAVWDDEELVPFAKAYSGLSDREFRQLDRWIRQHTIERFGPVRSVQAVQVFELAFEGLNPSKRHKSGIAVRFPRMLRWRQDLNIRDADSLAEIRRLLPPTPV